jgi:hypothetical protein
MELQLLTQKHEALASSHARCNENLEIATRCACENVIDVCIRIYIYMCVCVCVLCTMPIPLCFTLRNLSFTLCYTHTHTHRRAGESTAEVQVLQRQAASAETVIEQAKVPWKCVCSVYIMCIIDAYVYTHMHIYTYSGQQCRRCQHHRFPPQADPGFDL